MMKKRNWRKKSVDPLLRCILARELNISPTLASLLLNRGVNTVEDARDFLEGSLERLHNPYLMKDMEPAVNRILNAVKNRERIFVYGDYDADGITGTALLIKALRRLGANAGYYIPERLLEGYGLNEQFAEWARDEGVSLVVTVDCGIGGADVVARANELGGPDFVITDHHHLAVKLPEASAVLNPQRSDCAYPFKDLAGVGVALKLVQALFLRYNPGTEVDWQEYIELACIGTVADVVSLTGENRILVKSGLDYLNGCPANAGIKAILAVGGLRKDKIETKEISFIIVPRLNAPGRMGSAGQAVELLLAEDPAKAAELAAELDKSNRTRQEVEAGVLAGVHKLIKEDRFLAESEILVAADRGWHQGVIGIVASRLTDLLGRPVLLVSLEEDMGKGSGRSVPGFDLYEALASCRKYLTGFGGHSGAAGFSLAVDQLDNFRQAINEYAKELLSVELSPPIPEVEEVLPLAEITEQLASEILLLAPFGQGNPQPVIGCPGVTVLRSREVGKDGSHLKLVLQQEGAIRDGIGFRLADANGESVQGKVVDLICTPVLNHWNGFTSVELDVKEIIAPFEEKPGEKMCIEPGESQATAADEAPGPANGCGLFLDALFDSALEPLAADWNKMSLPDFALNWFQEYRRIYDRIFLPGWCEGCAQPSPEPGVFDLEKAPLIDLRNTTGRPSILAGLVGGGKQTLVLVDCAYRAIELAAYLRSSGNYSTAFLHRWISPAEREAVLYFFAGGSIGTLVTTAGLYSVLKSIEADQLVVYNLPSGEQEWNLAIKGLQREKRSVFLMFGEGDRSNFRDHLYSLAPDRDFLARLYALMRQFNNLAKGRILPELTSVLQKAGLKWAREYTTGIGLAVLHELGLVVERKTDEESILALSPAPKEKLKLEDSRVFCWGQASRDRAVTWQQDILSLPAWPNVEYKEGIMEYQE
ncbi:MAG: Single-stranded-DNA-specific exonuclease RecJ [Desulfotomaculum sp. 46_296]|nr:MAG: Single-stranded-DNA-specific exonuclease RecJ [Desulfotomaculum sp. 46_296]